MRAVARENMGKVTCATIQLGYMNAGLINKIPNDIREKIIENIPAKRLGTVEEIYNTIEYIVKTPYVSGFTLKLNGGLYD
jgi:NAD(P)-dependent dehydrogenase (short-subunit alcohol dehydrogenase family)